MIFSAALSVLIVILAHKKQWFLNHHDLSGVQKFHHHPTPHIGGLAIFLSFCMGYFLLPDLQGELLPLLLVSAPVFIVGLLEDFSAKILPLWRLIVIFISLGVSFIFLDIGIFSLGFMWMDNLLSYPIIGFIFTLIVVGGAVNALNIVDGCNGLMSGYVVLASVAMSVVSYQLGDTLILQLSLLLIATIAGFFLLNFPFGKIFMGDGGAYFIGFIFSAIGLVFVDRHNVLSNWFLLVLLMYPMYELLFSIYRRRVIHGTLASQPDDRHLHTLVHKLIVANNPQGDKVMNNSKTAPFLWALSLVSIIPAVLWYDDKFILIGCACVFMVIYTALYYFVAYFESIKAG